MQSRILIKTNLQTSMAMVLPLIEDMKSKPLVFPTPMGGNHPLWILGHLIYSDGVLLDEIMLDQPSAVADLKEYFQGGTEPVDDDIIYPSMGNLLTRCRDLRHGHMELLEQFSEEDLDQPSKNVPPKYQSYLATYRNCFMMVANHWLMHRGQVADARRADGRPRLES